MSEAEEVLAERQEDEYSCYYCQYPSAEPLVVCPECGHRQYRVCYCGERIAPNLPTCPHCGADWSESSRVRRSRRKSRNHGSVRGLLRSSVEGAAIGSVALGIVYYLLGRVAARAMLATDAPPGFWTRLSAVWQMIVLGMERLSQNLASLVETGRLAQFLGMLLLGAGVGAVVYLVRHTRWVRNLLRGARSHRRRCAH